MNSIFKPIVLWQGWADGADHRAVLDSGRTEILFEVKGTDALSEPCWRPVGDVVKKFGQPLLFAALVALGSKPDH